MERPKKPLRLAVLPILFTTGMQASSTEPAAGDEYKNATLAWMLCVRTHAERYSGLNETAESIATASISSCYEKERAHNHIIEQTFKDKGLTRPRDRADLERLRQDALDQIRAIAIKTVLDTRLKTREARQD